MLLIKVNFILKSFYYVLFISIFVEEKYKIMEQKKELKTVRVDYLCPQCKKGYLRPDGRALMSYPVQYPHECTECDYTETFNGKSYPYIDYIEILEL